MTEAKCELCFYTETEGLHMFQADTDLQLEDLCSNCEELVQENLRDLAEEKRHD